MLIDGLELYIVLILFAVAIVAGFVDSIAGGGGLLTIPALMILAPQLAPAVVLATNKLQGTFGSATASYTYGKAGHLNFKKHWFGFVCSFIGSGLGAAMVGQISGEFLKTLIPILLILMAIYFAFAPKLSDIDKYARMSTISHGLVFGTLIGGYDGFFGPGTGSFFVLTCVAFLGLGITQATAYTKLLNFASNIASLIVFAFTTKILVFVGLAMGIGQFIGARIGAKFALKNGAAIIKPLLVTVCISVAVKILLF